MDKPRRIAFLDSWKSSASDGSGTAVGISNLARALRHLGHEVEILRPTRGAGETIGRIAFNLGLPARLRSGARYDLVTGFDIDGFRWAARRDQQIPYVVCLKGIAVDEARYSRSIRERLHLSTLAWLERTNARQADRVILPSRYSADVARDRYRIPDDMLRVVPEAIDLSAWEDSRSPRARGTERPLILSVARQYPRKDTGTLLRAMPAVLEAHPGALLLIIGGGPELPRLRRLSQQLSLDRAVTFRGALGDDREVRAAFFDAQIFCLPSRQEGFGIVFVEAMAAGLPIVAARAAAVPEVVAEGETGLLVPPGDVQALAGALTTLIRDPRERARMGAAGVQRARAYGLDVVGRQFLSAASIGEVRG